MRVLWFANTSSLYESSINGYNGGGWISSLEENIRKDKDIELAVSFFYSKTEKCTQNNVTYYPVNVSLNIADKIYRNIKYDFYPQKEIDALLKVIDDFRPDVIHIFGTENIFGLLASHTKIPIVLHIQGILIPYLNSFLPPNVGKHELIKGFKLKELFSYLRLRKFVYIASLNEQKIFQLCKNYMGRTQWDKDVSEVFSPGRKYYYCSEILRTPFYEAQPWMVKTEPRKLKIVTTISQSTYKGFDLILKTAELLKNSLKIEFEWDVYGISEYRLWEKLLKIKSSDVNVNLNGIASAKTLVNVLQNADVFVHPSYIDNSPNSVCEAQMLGVPVVSTNVGGISSLIEDGKTGLLVPANDPYSMASRVAELKQNKEMAEKIGANARATAAERHNVAAIVKRNIEIYKYIIPYY